MNARAEQVYTEWHHTPILRAGFPCPPAEVPAELAAAARPTLITEDEVDGEYRGSRV
jgi:hypothetical protein